MATLTHVPDRTDICQPNTGIGRNVNYIEAKEVDQTNPSAVDVFQNHWKYRGEGNANIVIALPDHVIRLPKSKPGKKYEDEDETFRKKIERDTTFANQVIRPAIGEEFVGHVTSIELTSEQIGLLNQRLDSFRPKFRRDKTLKAPYATVHEDYTRINPAGIDYCIEVKPKQGVWPESLKENAKSPKLCVYCQNQYLKLKRNKISSTSNYCPLDLFSGEPKRMLKAIVALLQNPQNNLRIFRNGNLVYGDTHWHCDSLYKILTEICYSESEHVSPFKSLRNLIYVLSISLIQPGGGEENEESLEHFHNLKSSLEKLLMHAETVEGSESLPLQGAIDHLYRQFSEATFQCTDILHNSNLPKTCILTRILEVQRRCGIVERNLSKSIYDLYSEICPLHSKRNNKTSEHQKFHSVKLNGPSPCPDHACLTVEKWCDEISYLDKIEKYCIQEYLLAATAKDCSIMVAFSPDCTIGANKVGGVRHFDIEDWFKRRLKMKIGVADLDQKPLTCIVKHYLRDKDMRSAYKKFMIHEP